MAVRLESTINPRQLRELERTMDPRVIKRISASAVNDAGRFGETRVGRAVRQEIPLTVADTKRVIKRTKATASSDNPKSTITVKREPISMKRYKPRQTAKGVTVKPRKKKPRQLIKSAFIAETVGGHVFRRRGKERLPIDRQQGPTAVGVLDGVPKLLDELQDQINTKLAERFNSKLDAHIKGRAFKR